MLALHVGGSSGQPAFGLTTAIWNTSLRHAERSKRGRLRALTASKNRAFNNIFGQKCIIARLKTPSPFGAFLDFEFAQIALDVFF